MPAARNPIGKFYSIGVDLDNDGELHTVGGTPEITVRNDDDQLSDNHAVWSLGSIPSSYGTSSELNLSDETIDRIADSVIKKLKDDDSVQIVDEDKHRPTIPNEPVTFDHLDI